MDFPVSSTVPALGTEAPAPPGPSWSQDAPTPLLGMDGWMGMDVPLEVLALLCNAAASIFDGTTKPQLPGERWGLRTGALRDGLSSWQQELWKNPPGHQGLTVVASALPAEGGVPQSLLIWSHSRCGNPDPGRSSECWMDEQECVNVTFQQAGQGRCHWSLLLDSVSRLQV